MAGGGVDGGAKLGCGCWRGDSGSGCRISERLSVG